MQPLAILSLFVGMFGLVSGVVLYVSERAARLAEHERSEEYRTMYLQATKQIPSKIYRNV